jgi:hypothetical protein
MRPIDISIEEHVDFIMKRKLIFKVNEMKNELLNKEKKKLLRGKEIYLH